MSDDSGSWKVLIYPLVALIIVGGILALALKPLSDEGAEIPNNNEVVYNFNGLGNSTIIIPPNSDGSPSSLSGAEYIGLTSWNFIKSLFGGDPITTQVNSDNSTTLDLGENSFIAEVISLKNSGSYTLALLPAWLQVILGSILALCIGYGIYRLIPFI